MTGAALLGHELWGRRAGDQGPVVVWLHGYTMDSSIWDELWSRVPGYRHVGIDLPGHGRSPCVANDSIGTVADRLAALAGELDAVAVVAVSFGGLLALELAARIELAAVVLSSPQVPGGALDPAAQTKNLELHRLHRARGRGDWLTDAWMAWPPAIFRGASDHPALWARLRAVIAEHSWDELADPRWRWMVPLPDAASLARVRPRVLRVFVGEDDMPAFKRAAEILRRTIPGCDRVYVPGAGHLALLEQPAVLAGQVADALAASLG